MEQQDVWLTPPKFARALTHLGLSTSTPTIYNWIKSERFAPQKIVRTPTGRVFLHASNIDDIFRGKVSC